MNILTFLVSLKQKGIKITLNKDKLDIKAPKGAITNAIKTDLIRRKVEIIELLKSQNVTEDASFKIPTVDRSLNLPLSYSQERLWFLEQCNTEDGLFHMPGALIIRGSLNVEVLEKAIFTLIERHESLRTNFTMHNDTVCQTIYDAKESKWQLVHFDYSSMEYSDAKDRASLDIQHKVKMPFNLENDVLLRTYLYKIGSQEYVFSINMHHIISDGWSVSIFFKELSYLYNTYGAGKAPILGELPIDYPDYAVWQRDYLRGEVLDNQLDYWKKSLTGARNLDLPTDYTRPQVQSYKGDVFNYLLCEELAEKFEQLCHMTNTTLFMILQTAFKVLLSKLSDQEDVCIGSPIANRTRKEVEPLIGFFVNAIALRSNINAENTFEQLLEKVKQTSLEAYNYQEVPFDQIVSELKPERDASRSPFFQVWFNLVNVQENEIRLDNLEIEFLDIPLNVSKFDITLYIMEKSNGLLMQLVYNTSLFKESRIKELMDQYKIVLEQIVDDSSILIKDISLITNTAQTLLPSPVTVIKKEYYPTLDVMLYDAMKHWRDKIAVVNSEKVITYNELDLWTNRLANYIYAHSSDTGNVVAIYGNRSDLLVVALISVLKAGKAFVILDQNYPSERLKEYLNISNPAFLIDVRTTGNSDEILNHFIAMSGSQNHYITLSTLSIVEEYPSTRPNVVVNPDDQAYVAFTSGTTGKPKGVIGTHNPLSHFFNWYIKEFKFSCTDNFSMCSGLSHDPLLRDIFTPLLVGGTLYIPEQQEMETPGWLAKWLQNNKISVSHITPSMLHFIDCNGYENVQVNSLKHVVIGGEALNKDDILSFKKVFPSANAINGYGATETPQIMGYNIVSLDSYTEDNTFNQIKNNVPVGKGIDGVQLIILNRFRQLAGIGEKGEVFIRTPYLSNGYIGDSKSTDESFIKNPFTNYQDDYLYKSGDRGYYTSDGTVEITGRGDDQIKIRGFRIELQDIASNLEQVATVQKAIVTVTDEGTEKIIIAYILPADNISVDLEFIGQELKKRIPNYMIPKEYIVINTIPLTPNGKVDKKRLPIRSYNKIKCQSHVKPSNATEEALLDIWSQVLGKINISIHDDYFDLGGHSLLAVSLISKVNSYFNRNYPITMLFDTPTISLMAKQLMKTKDSFPSPVVAFNKDAPKIPLFVVPGASGNAQSMYSLIQHLDKEQPIYVYESYGLDGITPCLTSIEVIAKEYVKELKNIQPAGPYNLLGHSFGSLVCFEMAYQLEQQGSEVGSVTFFDTIAPTETKKMLKKHIKTTNEWILEIIQMISEITDSKFEVDENTLYQMTEDDLLLYVQSLLSQSGIEMNLTQLTGLLNVYRTNMSISYNPKYKINCKNIHIFKAMKKMPAMANNRLLDEFLEKPCLGWDEFTYHSPKEYYTPGNHISMINEPYVKVLAEKLVRFVS